MTIYIQKYESRFHEKGYFYFAFAKLECGKKIYFSERCNIHLGATTACYFSSYQNPEEILNETGRLKGLKDVKFEWLTEVIK